MKQQSSSIIPNEPPPPELAAEVRSALGVRDKAPPPPPPPGLAAVLPEGMTDAHPPLAGLKLPPLPEPPQRPADETMPAFGPIERVNLADLTHFGWLATRLALRHPHIGDGQWLGRLRLYMIDNAYLFVRSGQAAALAMLMRDAFKPKPTVMVLFCLHSEASKPERQDAERDCVRLVREIVRWAKTLGAEEVRGLTDFCDLNPSQLLHDVGGSERRDELFVRIR